MYRRWSSFIRGFESYNVKKCGDWRLFSFGNTYDISSHDWSIRGGRAAVLGDIQLATEMKLYGQ